MATELLPDAEVLCVKLAELIRPQLTIDTAIIGVHTGGAWLAERLHDALGMQDALGSIEVAFYRDDYGSRGLHARPRKSDIPFDIDDRPVILVDDVLYTGRTTRAALNELFDYGRPARVDLAVLVDRGERQLPISPSYCALTLSAPLAPNSSLRLARDDDKKLHFKLLTDAQNSFHGSP